MSIDVLNLEWPESERDLHISIPVCLYLRHKLGLTVVIDNIFNGYSLILKYKPKVLLISNAHGSFVNLELFRFADALGIKTVSLISEGNVNEKDIQSFFWGANLNKKYYLDNFILWSERSKLIFSKYFPEHKQSFHVSGATGFDRYNFLKNFDKSQILKKYNLENYKYIIGIAGWGFDRFMPSKYFEQNKSIFLSSAYGIEQVELFRGDLAKLQLIYKELVKKNPDVLFILRNHPGTMNYDQTEFELCKNEKNVFYSSGDNGKYHSIEDLLLMSDLWIGYESTTCLEAWLLNRITFFVNPTSVNFTRSSLLLGHPVVKNNSEAQKFIEEFKVTGKINDFEIRDKTRQEIIKDIIEHSDGKNHERASNLILDLMRSKKSKAKKWSQISFYRMIKSILKYHLTKKNHSENLRNKLINYYISNLFKK